MGYRIEIDEFVLRQLRNSPAEVFGKPYAGYLIFLAGAADREIVDWIAKNVVALDSLTGEDIAFGIFVRNLRAKIRTPDGVKRSSSQTPKIIDMPLSDLTGTASINSLFLSGKYGGIFDGDEINAITYATDEIARRFEVLNELPCIIILDALPRKSIEVFQLTSRNIDSLFSLLRRSIQNLRQQKDYPAFVKALRRLVWLQKDQSATHARIASFQNQQSRINHKDYMLVSQSLLEQFRNALLMGKVKQFYSFLNHHEVRVLFDQARINQAISIVQEEKVNLQVCANAIHRLHLYTTNYSWPLEEDIFAKYLYFLQKNAFFLLPDLSAESNLNDLAKCREIRERLIIRQSELIDKTIVAVLESKETEGIAREIANGERVKIENRIREEETRLKNIEKSISDSVKEIFGFDSISFIRCFKDEARKDQISTFTKQVRVSVSTYAGSWLQPDTLIEIGKVLTSP